ncbi:cyanophycin synthetase [Aurantibacillus circumpalustris]|uniref:cyanophycin synthetase n=1 Tax=Aurantibacillus circumpalustris TaxID=3036359 RepID=UPI00295AE121|nr:cyanophycin synthetase [Aurantibacillus circumpalustris]
MQIIEIKTLRGPNYWSNYRKKLIVMKLDLQELEQSPTNKIPGFLERLKKMFPTMVSHRCSKDYEGGFFERVEEGTWMGHVIEHIALEIQTLAGMEVGFGRTRGTGATGIYNVVFSYMEENVGVFAAKAAVAIAQSIVDAKEYDLTTDIIDMRKMRERVRFGPSTGSIVDEAVARNIPYIRLNKESLIQLGYGKNQVRFRATMTDRTSSIAVDLASNKDETKRMLEEAAIPVAKGMCISQLEQVKEVIDYVKFPLVFKPLDGNHGKGATINVKTEEEAIEAFHHAKKYSYRIIVEKFIQGFDFRVLVINNRFIAAALREPAHVIGDGKSTLQQLIDTENNDPRRGYGHENVLTEITIDKETLDQIAKYKYTLATVPKKNEKCYLKGTANLSTGGTSTDITDIMHPTNIFYCERISRVIGLDICGIDIMATNLSEPLESTGGVVLEVNAAPGFRMHLAPAVGLPRNVAAPVIDMLYPPGKDCRIPIIAVTGTNGKTTTTRLIAHIVKNNGYRVGFTTSDGIYVQNSMLTKGDTTGPISAEFILKDPTVEFAVLETARGGILRSGLGFGRCDVAVVTNIQEDHMGLSDINTLKDMANVKGVVVKSVKRDGYAVLNADNEYCVLLGKNADCNVAYFSLDENNKIIKEHCKKGGIAAIYENGFITIKKGEWKFRIDKVINIPLTFGGKVSFMISNVLAATLASYVYGFQIEDIKTNLETFIPSAAQTPGRMNVFDFKDYKVLIDFAHNPDGFKGIKEFLTSIESPLKIGIITGTGDRRDEDIREMGRISAEMFDHIIIRQDKFLRGRQAQEIVDLLFEGIKQHDKKKSYEYIPKEVEALKHAFTLAKPGAYIVALSDVIDNAIDVVHSYLEKERGG